jgi:hypothetical protein
MNKTDFLASLQGAYDTFGALMSSDFKWLLITGLVIGLGLIYSASLGEAELEEIDDGE